MREQIFIDISYWGDHTLEGWVFVYMLDQVLKPEQLNGFTFTIRYQHAHPNPAAVLQQLKWMSDRGAVILEIIHVQNRS